MPNSNKENIDLRREVRCLDETCNGERIQRLPARYEGNDVRNYGQRRNGNDPRPLDELLR
jgi:hypothetical protein